MNTPRHCLLAATLLFVGCTSKKEQPPPPPPKVPVVEVTIQDVPVYLEAVGETAGDLDIQIRARVDGVLEKMYFDEGTYVRKGELLYSIDPAPFEAKLREAQGQLAEANAQFVRADSDLKRVRPLVKIDALSKRTLDNAVAEFDASKGLVAAAQATVENAKIDLGYCQIHAPIDGLIGVSQAYESDFVGRYPNPIVLATVSKLDPIKVKFSISEQDYLRIVRQRQIAEATAGKREQKVPLELFLADGSRYPHMGTFLFAGREIDAQTGTLQIEATFPNPPFEVVSRETGKKEEAHTLRPGQFARVRATISVKKNATLVPQRAIRELQGTYQLYVVTPQNKIENRNVKVGVRVKDLWLIEEGVEPKERVVVSGLHRVRPGMTVRPVAPAAEK